MSKSEFPLVKVKRTEDTTNRYCRPGEGSRIHFLACGHEIRTKQSAGRSAKKRCRDCALGTCSNDPRIAEFRKMKTKELKLAWDKFDEDEADHWPEKGPHIEDVHKILNERGEGSYCAV